MKTRSRIFLCGASQMYIHVVISRPVFSMGITYSRMCGGLIRAGRMNIYALIDSHAQLLKTFGALGIENYTFETLRLFFYAHHTMPWFISLSVWDWNFPSDWIQFVDRYKNRTNRKVVYTLGRERRATFFCLLSKVFRVNIQDRYDNLNI